MPFRWKANSDREMTRGIRRYAKEFPDRLGIAIKKELEIDALECQRRTPVDTGALKASIHVEGPKENGTAISCQIVAGGIDAPYAIYVHEDLEALHIHGGQAKFIESVLRESAPYMSARIAARLKETE